MMDRSISLGMLAELVGGKVVGDAATVIRGAAVLGEVAGGEITFIDQAERVKQLASTEAAAVVIPAELEWGTSGVRHRCATVPATRLATRRSA